MLTFPNKRLTQKIVFKIATNKTVTAYVNKKTASQQAKPASSTRPGHLDS